MVVTVIDVPRKDVGLVRKVKGNLLIYGRRKVGKTFLVRNHIDHDVYFLVKRGGGIHVDGLPFTSIDSYSQFEDVLTSLLGEGRTVAVDEFQRLPDSFLDLVQIVHGNGRLVLLGSSFHIVKDVLGPRSPVLGLLSEYRMSLISPMDMFSFLGAQVPPRKAFELSLYLRDPWTLQHFKGRKTSIAEILFFSKGAVRALLGEVFLEEDRQLSGVYEGILRQLAVGRWKLKEVADVLHGRGLIGRADQSLIRPYLHNMMEMDLVGRIPIHGKNEYMYHLRSPVMELGFRLDETHDLFDGEMGLDDISRIAADILPRHVERFTGEFMAEVLGGSYQYFYSSDFDIDFIITKGKKVLTTGEVKWSKRVRSSDISAFLDRTSHLPGEKVFLSIGPVDAEGFLSITPEMLLDGRFVNGFRKKCHVGRRSA